MLTGAPSLVLQNAEKEMGCCSSRPPGAHEWQVCVPPEGAFHRPAGTLFTSHSPLLRQCAAEQPRLSLCGAQSLCWRAVEEEDRKSGDTAERCRRRALLGRGL